MVTPAADVDSARAVSAFAPLRHRAFALIWIGAFVSNIGTWMETVALGFWVEDETGQALWPGIIAAAGFVPIAVLGPIGGAVADRRSRTITLAITTLVQASVAATLCALAIADGLEPPLVAVLVLVGGAASAIGFPSYQAMMPDLVPPEELVAAIGLGSAQWNLGRVVGPLLAGLALQAGGIAWALGINAASFVAVLVALAAVGVLPAPGASTGSVWRSIADGFGAVRTEPGLRVSFIAMCVNSALAAPFIALIPAMAGDVLDGDETTISILVTAQGVGAVVAALRLGSLSQRYGSRRVLTIAMGVSPVLLAAYALAPTTALVAVALAALGAGYLVSLSSFTAVAQQRAPSFLRGRVLAVNTVVLGTMYPLGALVQGRAADMFGLRATTVAAAVVMALVVWGTALLRPQALASLDRPSTLLTDSGSPEESPSV